MVGQNHKKYHGGGICYIVIYYGILLFYAGMGFELDYNNKLYWLHFVDWALSKLYCTWYTTNLQSEFMTTNTVTVLEFRIKKKN